MQKLLSVSLFILTFNSCEIAPVYLSEENPQIVVECFFKPDDPFLLYLGETRFTHEFELDTPAALSKAEVRLFENGELIGLFMENDTLPPNVRFLDRQAVYTLDYYPVPGKTYRIEVSKEGYESVWAESQIPPARGYIEAIGTSKTNRLDPENDFVEYLFNVSILLKDPPGTDYYHLDIYSRAWLIDLLTSDTINTRFSEEFINVDQGFIIQTSGPFWSELIFDDILFEGADLQIDFRQLTGAGSTRVLRKDTDLKNLTEDNYAKYYPYLRNVSFEYHEYYRTAMQQLETIDDPFAEPVRIYSNIHGGKGVFAGYNEQVFEIPAGFFFYEGE